MDKILVLDFGSQTTALIGRRIRELGVYSEVIPGDTPLTDEFLASDTCKGVKGLILSGSPESVYTKEGSVPDPKVYSCGLPLLGICYGLQRMTYDNGGKVEALPKREYGGVGVTLDDADPPPHALSFINGFKKKSFTAWMSHGDTLTRLAPGFLQFGTSETGFPAVVIHESKSWFGLQFHPEVTHSEGGLDILAAYTFGVCRCEKNWTMEHYVEEVRRSLAARVEKNPVLLLISGGVDSTVAGALLLKTLDPDHVHLMYMDTGLMRKDETKTVKVALEKLGARHLHIIHCEDEFLAKLKGLEDPEAKRKAIGDLFITIQEREVARLGLPDSYFLAQGTLYTDLIESGKGVGKKAHLIKSHHNVGSPLVDAKRKAGRIIEPLDKLYKDEVRALGRLLVVDEEVVRRHPFPGPGLGVRILGEVTKEKCDILREADAIFISELKKRNLYDEIWQAFAVLLPIRSVGVAGDVRKYGWVLALRAITSADGMTADVYPFPTKDLLEISTLITNEVQDIGRVTYDISSKPPATIEWE
ncbi:glutamine-hydrolyzing GMP synthase [Leadbettera azotonutricia]|uniref:GMP synthase (glutamine-hydrolyzing) n=1 Tax=Leadbettera azotonutricia (strain ATCC BAA-888 / DSM 13862 / ZAS-9) TaxID=545695 RepID=F5YDZ1_LEAAZ|nr:glutamine-hydrolyzing GMP synthase [Leadbettera azotonutricia]AEF80384.1 GMP synthase (glutamine-hydrolyzing) [Leadbettera azotonutricia ZAS-9]